jgi:hypothetical protein
MIEFPYTSYKGLPAPIIPLTLITNQQASRVWTYVDSGAIYSIFKVSEAEKAGLDFKQGKKLYAMVGDGSLIPVYLHRVNILIGNEKLTATIGFSERLGVGFNLLGRTDIFTKFTVCFNDQVKKITFTPNF